MAQISGKSALWLKILINLTLFLCTLFEKDMLFFDAQHLFVSSDSKYYKYRLLQTHLRWSCLVSNVDQAKCKTNQIQIKFIAYKDSLLKTH